MECNKDIWQKAKERGLIDPQPIREPVRWVCRHDFEPSELQVIERMAMAFKWFWMDELEESHKETKRALALIGDKDAPVRFMNNLIEKASRYMDRMGAEPDVYFFDESLGLTEKDLKRWAKVSKAFEKAHEKERKRLKKEWKIYGK